jgi:iduronate 2-sulfatase
MLQVEPYGIKNAKANGYVELLDFIQTFCVLANIHKQERIDGKSFLPLLKNPNRDEKNAAFCSMPQGSGFGRAVRTKDWS